jgi:hypothetical protein
MLQAKQGGSKQAPIVVPEASPKLNVVTLLFFLFELVFL